MPWQIALKLVRQGSTFEPAVASVQVIEPKEIEVDLDKSDQTAAETKNSEVLESPEQLSENSVEVDNMQTDLPADQSQGAANQSADIQVFSNYDIMLWNGRTNIISLFLNVHIPSGV